MGDPVKFAGSNAVLGPPKGKDETQVRSMDVFRNGTCCVSCWRLTPEELQAVNESGGLVWVSVFWGATQPPIFIGDEESVRRIAADYGVWKKPTE